MDKKKKIFKILDVTFGKFLIVGVLNTFVGMTVMFTAYNIFHLNYWVSSVSNYVVGSVLSYFLNKYFTFKNEKKSWQQIVIFVVNISVCYVIAYGLAKPLTLWILEGYEKRVQENVSMLIGRGVFVLLNYFGQRLIVFRKQDKEI